MSTSIPRSRREEIQSRLTAGDSVSSAALATEFGVSEDAIRRNLRALAAAGHCRRVYGGALPNTADPVSMATRLGEGIVQKQALAIAAASLIEHGSFVFIDNGSANLAVVAALPRDAGLTVATSSLEVAASLAKRGDVRLLLVGGEYDPFIGGCVDGSALAAISAMNIDLCLLGACAVSDGGGVSAFEFADATFKRALVANSRRTIALATNDKLDWQAPHRIVALDALHRLVIEHDAPDDVASVLHIPAERILRAPAASSPASFPEAQ